MKMKKKSTLIIAVSVVAAAIIIAAGIVFASMQNYGAFFKDVSIELGTETVSISDFYSENAQPGHSSFVTDVSAIDLSRVGDYPVTLKYGNTEETVLLSVSDTTAPEVVFADELTVPADTLPEAEDFILEARDMSPVTISFAQELHIPRDYEDISAVVVVADEYGNETKQSCTVHFSWLRSEITLERGETITAEDVLYCPERDILLIDSEAIEAVNKDGDGTYILYSSIGEKSVSSEITVRDTTAPELQVKDLIVRTGDEISPEDFVTLARDISGKVSLSFKSEPATDEEGEQSIVIEATDSAGNKTERSALMTVVDKKTPVFSGLTTMLVPRGRYPQYRRDVEALTGYYYPCYFSVDDSEVDINTPGTYYVTYEAQTAGIVVTEQRKVIILDDGEGTDLIVESIAEGLSSDPEEIRNYVRSSISYSHEWGDDDPVWFGFSYKRGNCYVHAQCLKAIFDYKGIESQLIWVTNETHYWLIVKIDGQWKHIDATPSAEHSRFSLMNDTQRLLTLSGRTWDKELWPACE